MIETKAVREDSLESTMQYIQQVYAYLTGSLIISVTASWVSMGNQWVQDNLLALTIVWFGLIFVSFKWSNVITLFGFTGIGGMLIAPILTKYEMADKIGIVGEAAAITIASFMALTIYTFTTKKDFSSWYRILFISLISLFVALLGNLFFQSEVFDTFLAWVTVVIFSGFILYDTDYMRRNPWKIHPTSAAIDMYLNIINFFLAVLRIRD